MGKSHVDSGAVGRIGSQMTESEKKFWKGLFWIIFAAAIVLSVLDIFTLTRFLRQGDMEKYGFGFWVFGVGKYLFLLVSVVFRGQTGVWLLAAFVVLYPCFLAVLS